MKDYASKIENNYDWIEHIGEKFYDKYHFDFMKINVPIKIFKEDKMKTYIFKVRKIQNINIERIEEEVQKDNPYAIGFILAINDDDDNALYLYEEFLDLWSGSNAPEICGEKLDLSWGFSHNGLSHNGLLECKKTRVRSFKKEELSQIIEKLKNLRHPISYKVKVISIPL